MRKWLRCQPWRPLSRKSRQLPGSWGLEHWALTQGRQPAASGVQKGWGRSDGWSQGAPPVVSEAVNTSWGVKTRVKPGAWGQGPPFSLEGQ